MCEPILSAAGLGPGSGSSVGTQQADDEDLMDHDEL